jgi:single-strand DNA-binding protein
MALYENKTTLKGFIGKDAETFTTKQQRNMAVLSLATKSGYKDKQTEQWVNHTEWHRIVVFGKPVQYAKGLKKGDYVQIEGELRSYEFETVTDGVTAKHQRWEIHASLVKKLEAPAKSQADNPDAEPVSHDQAA